MTIIKIIILIINFIIIPLLRIPIIYTDKKQTVTTNLRLSKKVILKQLRFFDETEN